MKIQIPLSISFHLNMSYKVSICDTCFLKKHELQKLNQQIVNIFFELLELNLIFKNPYLNQFLLN
jgi:hypothetical protein